MHNRIEIAVADTGQGIGADFLPYVFDRFRQADASTTRSHGGLGLGLSIVKQLVELHGGNVRAHSLGLDRGTTFFITLPVDASQSTPTSSAAAAQTGGRVAASNGIFGTRILVVDDDADARDLLRRLLEESGAHVTLAASSPQALDIIRQGGLDILVSDIGMPGEDGYALLRRLRGLPPEQGGHLPAVALTAYARAEDRAKALRAGFQMHLAKPIEPTELIATLATLARSGTLFP